MSELTTTQVSVRLGVGTSTVRLWCQQGRFPGAREEQTLRGPVWLIPEGALEGFVKPKRGRPRKEQQKAA
jgi:excisionase family DNA binding protein